MLQKSRFTKCDSRALELTFRPSLYCMYNTYVGLCSVAPPRGVQGVAEGGNAQAQSIRTKEL